MQETATNNENLLEFYQGAYPMQRDRAKDLVAINVITNPVVVIDCCGWHYQATFNKDITMLETKSTVKSYSLTSTQYSHLIDDSGDNYVWPVLDQIIQPVLVLDRSPLLRYRSLKSMTDIVNQLMVMYSPHSIIMRNYLQFVDDDRFKDRIVNWLEFFASLSNCVTIQFVYDTATMFYSIKLKSIQ